LRCYASCCRWGDIDLGQFLLEFGVVREFLSLAGEIGLFGVGLRTDQDILSRRHGHGTGDQTGDAGKRDLAAPRGGLSHTEHDIAVEMIPSLAPSTAARSHPIRSTTWTSR
jgi:hypothetical protein